MKVFIIRLFIFAQLFLLCGHAHAQTNFNVDQLEQHVKKVQEETIKQLNSTLLNNLENPLVTTPLNTKNIDAINEEIPNTANQLNHLISESKDSSEVMKLLGFKANYATEGTVFDGRNVNIVLPIGAEKTLIFPDKSTFNRHQSLDSLLVVYGLSNQFTIKAVAEFPPTLNVIKDIDTGLTYLLNISAEKDGGNTETLEILHAYSQQYAAKQGKTPTNNLHTTQPQIPLPNVSTRRNHGQDYIIENTAKLIQYAAQQHYAPTRLLKEINGIDRIRLEKKLYPIFPPEIISSLPLASWTDGNLYVTSVVIENNTNEHQILDWTDIRYGNIVASGFLNSDLTPRSQIRLFPSGNASSKTIMFVATREPFPITVQRWEAGL